MAPPPLKQYGRVICDDERHIFDTSREASETKMPLAIFNKDIGVNGIVVARGGSRGDQAKVCERARCSSGRTGQKNGGIFRTKAGGCIPNQEFRTIVVALGCP